MSSASAIRAGQAYIELFTKDAQFTRGLRLAQRRLDSFSRSAKSIGKTIGSFGLAAVTPIGFALRSYAGFSDQMSKVKAVTTGTAAEFRKLEATAERLGGTTSFAASQVAEGMVELGRMGFDRTQIDQSIAGVLDLSRATDTELPMAAAIGGAALRQFSLDASEFPRVADVLTVTANSSAQTLEDLGEALKPVGPLAAEAGDSLESTAAAAGILANNAIRGSLAGNALARAYKNLSTEATQKTLRGFGVEAVDSEKNLRPLATILAELGASSKKLGSAEKLARFETLFGRGQVAALKLANSGDDFNNLLSALQAVNGESAKTAAEMDANLGGFFRRFMSMVERSANGLAKQITPAIIGLEKPVTAIFEAVDEWVKTNRNLVLGLTLATVAAVVLGGGLIGVGMAVSILSFAIGGLATLISLAGAAASMFLGMLGALLSPIGLVAAALIGAGYAFFTMTDAGKETLGWLAKQFGIFRDIAVSTFGGIADALSSGNLALAGEIAMLGLQAVWIQGTSTLSNLWTNLTSTIFNTLSYAFGNVQTIFFRMVGELSKSWSKFSASFEKGWTSTQNSIAKQLVKVMAYFDSSIDADEAMSILDEQQAARIKAIDRERDATIAANDEITKQNVERVQKETEQTVDARNEAASKALLDTEAKVTEARKKLAEAVARANQTKAEGDESELGEGSPAARNLSNALAGSVSAAVASAARNTALDARSHEGISAIIAATSGGGQTIESKMLTELQDQTSALAELLIEQRKNKPGSTIELTEEYA